MRRSRRVLAQRAQRDLAEIPEDERRAIRRAIRALPGGDVIRLRHHPGLFRLRVEDWRVVFTADERQRRIDVLLVDHREVVYTRLQEL